MQQKFISLIFILLILLTGCQNTDQRFEEANKKHFDKVFDSLSLSATPYDFNVDFREAFIKGFREGFVRSVFENVGTHCIFTDDKKIRAHAHGFREGQSLFLTVIANLDEKSIEEQVNNPFDNPDSATFPEQIEKLKAENQKLSNQVKELRKMEGQKKKELAKSLIHIKWKEVIGKMESWTLKELQERVLDLKQNTQGVERANKTWIEKQFSDLSNQERLTPEERNRRAVENEYMKLLFIYQLKRAENILLMPAQLE